MGVMREIRALLVSLACEGSHALMHMTSKGTDINGATDGDGLFIFRRGRYLLLLSMVLWGGGVMGISCIKVVRSRHVGLVQSRSVA